MARCNALAVARCIAFRCIAFRCAALVLVIAVLAGCGGGGGSSNKRPDLGRSCGGIQGTTCSDGYFCEFPLNSCGARNTTGTCEIRPEVCADVVNPVCGCN